jgi:type II secretory pathway pseudopilin PulG
MRRKFQSKASFTLLETLITVSIVAMLAATVPLTLNFKSQTGKAQDVRRKAELKTMATVLSDYYNDNGKYPDATKFCVGAVSSPDGSTCSCTVCGTDSGSPTFQPYLSHLGCDPQYPQKTYLYQFDCQDQQWFRLCSALSTDTSHPFAYGVSSGNVTVDECKNIAAVSRTSPTTQPSATQTPIPSNTLTPVPSNTPVPTSTTIPTPSNTPQPSATLIPTSIPTPSLTPTPQTLYVASKVIGSLYYTYWPWTSTTGPVNATPVSTLTLVPSDPTKASSSCMYRSYTYSNCYAGWNSCSLVTYYYYDCTVTFNYLEGTSPQCQTLTTSPSPSHLFYFNTASKTVCPGQNYGLTNNTYTYPYFPSDFGRALSNPNNNFDSNWNIYYTGR